MEIDYNKIDKDLPGIVVKDKMEHKTYKFSEVLYHDGLTGDLIEEFKENG